MNGYVVLLQGTSSHPQCYSEVAAFDSFYILLNKYLLPLCCTANYFLKYSIFLKKYRNRVQKSYGVTGSWCDKIV